MKDISIPIFSPVDQARALRKEIESAMLDVVSSGVWLNGKWTRQFAKEFAEWCGVKYCIPVANGTDALELAMRALGVGPGDEVITAANAGGYATSACRLVGATPIWVDVRPATLGLDPEQVAPAVTDRTRLIVVTHLYGLLGDVEAIRSAVGSLRRPDIRILEDCAQAHGASRDGRKAGSLGDIAAFSFYPTKNLGALGDAGAVTTDSAELAERVDRLRQYGWTEKYRSSVAGGRNSRIDELQAAILCVKLPFVDRWNARRREVFANYTAGIGAPNSIVGSVHDANVAHMVVMRSTNRSHVRRFLAQAGVGTDIHYPVLDCDQPSQLNLPSRKLPLPVSECARDEILTLPCYPELSDDKIEFVIAAVNAAPSDRFGMGQRQ